MNQSYCHQLDVPAFLRKHECGPDWLSQVRRDSFCFQEGEFEHECEEPVIAFDALDEALPETFSENPFLHDVDWLNIPTFLRKPSTEALFETDVNVNSFHSSEDDVEHLIEVLKFRSENEIAWPERINELYLLGISEQTCQFLKQYMKGTRELSEASICSLFISVVTD